MAPSQNKRGKESAASSLSFNLTSSQLAFAICVLLIAAVICFCSGMVVERVLSDGPVISEEPARLESPTPADATATAEPRGRQTSPRELPADRLARREEPRTIEGGVEEYAAPSAPPPRSNGKAAPPQIEMPVLPDPDKQPEPAPPSVPEKPEPPTPEEQPETVPESKTEPKTTPTPSKPATEERFGIQIGAYGEAKNAERLYARLNDELDYDVHLVGSGKQTLLIVGSFTSREEANRVREKLKNREGMANCFVKRF